MVVAFAIVHFTVGFVIVLFVLSVFPVTRYRLTGAFTGGIFALLPDTHHFIPGRLGDMASVIHADPRSNIFFFHTFLDRPAMRDINFELTLLSLIVLGFTFLIYDWRFGRLYHSRQVIDTTDATEESSDS